MGVYNLQICREIIKQPTKNKLCADAQKEWLYFLVIADCKSLCTLPEIHMW